MSSCKQYHICGNYGVTIRSPDNVFFCPRSGKKGEKTVSPGHSEITYPAVL